MIELDGSHLEGGGALVRVALALSALTGKEFNVTNIRSGRAEKGLKAQHVHAIKALKQLCNAETSEVDIGVTELHFKPGKLQSGIYEIDIGTAGSITLLLQALILPALFAPAKVTFKITGGTCGKWQASVDYLQNILLPHLQRFAEKIELKIVKRGYYPQGGGKMVLEISPKVKRKDFAAFSDFCTELSKISPPIVLTEPGKLEQVRGIVNVSADLQEKEVAERIKRAAEDSLKNYEVPVTVRIEYVQSLSVGGEVLLWGVFSQGGKINPVNPVLLAGDALVELGKKSEQIGKEAAEKVRQEIESNAAVDHYLADQLIMFMGLLPGSTIKVGEVSNHTKTNIHIVEQFLPVQFQVDNATIRVQRKEQ